MRISNFTGEKNTYSINVRISDGDYSRGTNALRGYVVGSSSCTPLQLDRQYFYAYFAANILGSAESFPQALRETLRLKSNTKSNTTVKEWYFKKSVCETYEVTPPEKQGRCKSPMIDQSDISIAPLPC